MPQASECALLVAIPMDESEYSHDASRCSDFTEAYARQLGIANPMNGWIAYARYAALCTSVVKRAQKAGVAVTCRAPLSCLAEAARRFAVVTLVAHSRGPEITARDIVDAPALIQAESTLRDAMNPSAPALSRGSSRTAVAAWLDALLGPAEMGDADAPIDVRESAWRIRLFRERSERRRMVERICPGALAGGPGIEFHDGLHSLDAVDAALPHTLECTLDLTVCDSVLLADRIRARRTTGVILANARPTTPDFRLILYRETITLMVRHRLSYADAALSIRRALR